MFRFSQYGLKGVQKAKMGLADKFKKLTWFPFLKIQTVA